MDRRPSIAGRATLALALTVGFYVLVLGLAATLCAIPILLHTAAGARAGLVKLDFFLLVAAFGLVSSAWPRRERFSKPGVLVDEEQQPRLFGIVREIADATGEEMPHEVYVNGDLNAAVTHHGGRLGVGQTRVLIVGLPLLQGLTDHEMRAVLAHEFGHFAGGDTKVGAWLYRTRSSIGRTVQQMAENASWLRFLFVWYGKLFLRVTHAVSRQQEFAADRVSAEVIGTEPAASALRKLPGLDFAFQTFVQNEFLPVVQAGLRPPFAAGLARFLEAPPVVELRGKVGDAASRQEKHDPYDTHPPIALRVAAIEELGASDAPVDGPPATSWLDDLPDLEAQVMRFQLRSAEVTKMETVRWEDVGQRVVLPGVRARRATVPAGLLEDVTLGGLGDLVPRLGEIGGEIGEAVGLDRSQLPDKDARVAFATHVLGDCALAALADAGWRIDSVLGGPCVARQGDQEIAPRQALWLLMQGELAADEWRQRCATAGVSELPLAAPDTPAPAAEATTPAAGSGVPAPVAEPADEARSRRETRSRAAPKRRSVRERMDPASDRRRRRLFVGGTAVVIAVALTAYGLWLKGRPPAAPVHELSVLAGALDDRDVDTVVALWDRSVDRDGLREGIARLFQQLGTRGTTPRPDPPRVRRLDDHTYRAIYRIGEIDLESRWVWDGERFRVGALDLVR